MSDNSWFFDGQTSLQLVRYADCEHPVAFAFLTQTRSIVVTHGVEQNAKMAFPEGEDRRGEIVQWLRDVHEFEAV